MEITTAQIEDLHLNLNMDSDDFEFRAYSGRYMFGEESLALVTDASPWTIMRALTAYHKEISEPYFTSGEPADRALVDVLEYLIENNPSTDDMGMSTVYYWTGVMVNG